MVVLSSLQTSTPKHGVATLMFYSELRCSWDYTRHKAEFCFPTVLNTVVVEILLFPLYHFETFSVRSDMHVRKKKYITSFHEDIYCIKMTKKSLYFLQQIVINGLRHV